MNMNEWHELMDCIFWRIVVSHLCNIHEGCLLKYWSTMIYNTVNDKFSFI